mgnify:CR=1 FL=1
MRRVRKWERDPTGTRPRGGPAPDGHTRRCQSACRRDPDRQCGQWARKGSLYCKFHGGNQPRHKTFEMSNWYSKRAGPILQDRLKELRESSPDERHSLSDEIDLARLIAERNVVIYERTVMVDKGSAELKASATESLRSSLDHVTDIVSKAARVHSISSSVVELEHIDYILQQVTRIIEEEVASNDQKMADVVLEKLKGIKLPEGRAADAEDNARSLRDAMKDMDLTIGGEV